LCLIDDMAACIIIQQGMKIVSERKSLA